MKKEFVKPVVEVVELENSTILCSSLTGGDGGSGEDGGGSVGE